MVQIVRRAWVLAVLTASVPLTAAAQTLTVFAAASLTEALTAAGAAWSRMGPAKPRFSFAASSTLARQVEQGAPANLFVSADQKWMDYLDQRGLLAPGTRRDLLRNQLVLVVPKDHARRVAIGTGLDLGALLGPGGRLAVGDPAHVPAGIYAKQSLQKLGLWQSAEPRLARAPDVRAALRLVELGEAPAGIVYATDAAASDAVAIAGVLPPESHDPIIYPVAVIRTGDTPQARAFLDFLRGPQAQSMFAARGFGRTD